MDVETHGDPTLELLERVYQLREVTHEWFHNPKYMDSWPLFKTQDKWTIVKYVMELLRPLQYWTLWMSNWHIVTLHHVFTVFNDMFNHTDGVMRALATKLTPWRKDLIFDVKLARKKLSKHYAEVNPTTNILLLSARILDRFQKLRSFRKWDNGMDIDPQDTTSYTTQYQEAL